MKFTPANHEESVTSNVTVRAPSSPDSCTFDTSGFFVS